MQLPKDETYGNVLELIEHIRQDMENGYAPRIGQMGALFRLGAATKEAIDNESDREPGPDEYRCPTCGQIAHY